MANYRLVLIPPQKRLCKLNRGSDRIPRVFEPGGLIFNEGSVCSVSGATDPFPPPPGRVGVGWNEFEYKNRVICTG